MKRDVYYMKRDLKKGFTEQGKWLHAKSLICMYKNRTIDLKRDLEHFQGDLEKSPTTEGTKLQVYSLIYVYEKIPIDTRKETYDCLCKET